MASRDWGRCAVLSACVGMLAGCVPAHAFPLMLDAMASPRYTCESDTFMVNFDQCGDGGTLTTPEFPAPFTLNPMPPPACCIGIILPADANECPNNFESGSFGPLLLGAGWPQLLSLSATDHGVPQSSP